MVPRASHILLSSILRHMSPSVFPVDSGQTRRGSGVSRGRGQNSPVDPTPISLCLMQTARRNNMCAHNILISVSKNKHSLQREEDSGKNTATKTQTEPKTWTKNKWKVEPKKIGKLIFLLLPISLKGIQGHWPLLGKVSDHFNFFFLFLLCMSLQVWGSP